MPLFIFFFFPFLLVSCNTISMDNKAGIVDSHFTKAFIHIEEGQPPDLEILFRPNIFSIGKGAEKNLYTVSFSIIKANAGEDSFYHHMNAFLSFRNEGTLENPSLRYTGLIIKNCHVSCEDIFTAFHNEAGKDITTDIHSPDTLLTRNMSDEFFHLHVCIDPIHMGESWRVIHGYPGVVGDISQLIYPYYRVDFIIKNITKQREANYGN